MNKLKTNLGGVTPDELVEYSKESGGPPGVANVSPQARFVVNVARLVLRRTQASEEFEHCVFILCRRVREHRKLCVGATHPFLSTGDEPISGRVWLTSAPMGDALELDQALTTDGETFDLLQNGPLPTNPTIFVKWVDGEPAVNYYPQGLENADDMIRLDLSDSVITEEKMKQCLDRFHQTRLVAPALVREGGGVPIWQNASQGIPSESVEKAIQGRLMDTLQAKFPFHELRGEPPVAEGRADIVVWTKTRDAHDAVVVRNDWVLELKALKEKTNTGKPVNKSSIKQAIDDGCEQATRYKQKLSAQNAALCCFDMRKTNEGDTSCFKNIAEDIAIELNQWRWFLYRSAKELRIAISTGEYVET